MKQNELDELLNGGKANLKQMNGRGQELLRRAVGMAGKMAGRQTKPAEQNHCRRTQPADSPLGTGLKTHGPQMAGLAAKTQPQMTSASRRAGKWGECDGTQKGGLRPTYLYLPHLSPLPVTVPTHSLNL